MQEKGKEFAGYQKDRIVKCRRRKIEKKANGEQMMDREVGLAMPLPEGNQNFLGMSGGRAR